MNNRGLSIPVLFQVRELLKVRVNLDNCTQFFHPSLHTSSDLI